MEDNILIQIKDKPFLKYFKEISSCVIIDDNEYYFFPYWVQPRGHDIYTIYHLDNLPPDLKNAIKKLRHE